MRRRLVLALAGLATAAVTAGLAYRRLRGQGPQVESVSYKQTPQGSLALDIYRPVATGDARGALLFFFGGGWVAGNRRQFAPQADYFARRGLVCLLVDYRVSGRHGTGIAEAVEDAADAYSWLQRHAANLGVDPTAIALAGGSAGGHLAACIATGCGAPAAQPRPAALLLYNPVLDLTDARAGLGFSRGERELIAALPAGEPFRLSPADRLCELPIPRLLLFGERDPLLARAEQLDCPGEPGLRRLTWPGVGHGFFNREPWRRETTQAAHRFLADAGLLSPPSAVSAVKPSTMSSTRSPEP